MRPMRTTVRGAIAGGGCALLFGLVAPAGAQEDALSHWKASAPAIPERTHSLGPSDTARIAEWKVYPTEAAALTGPARSRARGALALPADTQLFRLRFREHRVYCSAAPSKWGSERNHCLVDRDRDGRFDHHYLARDIGSNFPSLQGFSERELRPLAAPVAYRRIDPRSYRDAATLALEYIGRPRAFGSAVAFVLVFGSPYRTGVMQEFTVDGSALPSEFSVRDVRVRAVGRNKSLLRFEAEYAPPAGGRSRAG